MAERDASARLRRAVKENNLFLVKRLINRTDMRNPDASNKRYTSLAWAAVLGHEETFEFLLGCGHDDPEYSKDSDNNTILTLLADATPPLSYPQRPAAADQDFLGATLRMARLYFDRYPDILDWANSEGKTALHVAAVKGNEELVRMLCDLGADFDLADDAGNIPLHYASAWGHIPIVQLLIERGCIYTAKNNQGFTPSDYAYSNNTRDTLQDTARTQMELNKKARRNLLTQPARSVERAPAAQVYPSSMRSGANGNGAPRMRSGSGTSRTTTTSDSGDWYDPGMPGPSRPSLNSSFSPARRPAPLPNNGQYSPGQPSVSSAGSSSTYGFSHSPVSQPNSATLHPPTTNPASVLSPIATRMRERDADAMEKYKLRQRSGSGTTTSDSPSQNDQLGGSSGSQEDDISKLVSVVGSVAPRRRLRPSASATQLRSTPHPITIPPHNASQDMRHRAGTSPATYKRNSPILESMALPTPTQSSTNATMRPHAMRSNSSWDMSDINTYMGPPSEYAQFPPPPPAKDTPADRTPTPAAAPAPAYTRRLPFNLLSSQKGSGLDVSRGSHRRNASVNTAVR